MSKVHPFQILYNNAIKQCIFTQNAKISLCGRFEKAFRIPLQFFTFKMSMEQISQCQQFILRFLKPQDIVKHIFTKSNLFLPPERNTINC